HLLHRFGPELICVLLAVAHKHLGHCHQLWQPDVYERLAGPTSFLLSEFNLPLKLLNMSLFRPQTGTKLTEFIVFLVRCSHVLL
ncbi:hypothetical protein, partial [Pseudomonas aeruginosa]|uniref:hypothetical protein n=1 Tax=Pseudomonas aeruginosa TaxID=287 RepID=UPI0039E929DC